MGFFKKLFCFYYYEDRPSVEFYEEFITSVNPLGFGGMKLVICNKCGKTTCKPWDFIDIKQI